MSNTDPHQKTPKEFIQHANDVLKIWQTCTFGMIDFDSYLNFSLADTILHNLEILYCIINDGKYSFSHLVSDQNYINTVSRTLIVVSDLQSITVQICYISDRKLWLHGGNLSLHIWCVHLTTWYAINYLCGQIKFNSQFYVQKRIEINFLTLVP